MIRISVKNISIVCILSSIFFFIVSCGGGSGNIEAVSVPNGEFQQFVENGQKMTPADFCQWWNDSERYNGWIFSYYGQNGLIYPDYSTPEQIFESKIINCYRISVLLKAIYGGEIVYVSQPDSQYDHCYLRLTEGKIDNCGLMLKYISE